MESQQKGQGNAGAGAAGTIYLIHFGRPYVSANGKAEPEAEAG
jgi:hypothetical protein